ncbi:MAG: M20/M25/M40 family metallo-hydrolase [Clostridia bacterium]|nr:M20/M25/M40 family metallo-hydrolase [Clostridia bacterium]
MSKFDKAFSRIDELNGEFIKIWEDVCNIESPTEHKAGVDAVGRYFLDYAKRRGWQCEVFAQEVSGDIVCITLNPTAKKRPLTLSAHLDTVHPIGFFGYPPVHCDTERIYGPGVTDCKGGAVSALLAMTALDDTGFIDRPVRLILQTDEEKSSVPSGKSTINYIIEKSKDSVAFLNAEGGKEDGGVIFRRGIAVFEFEVTGISTHASNCVNGKSAVLEAAHKIIEIEKLRDIDALTANCGLISGGTAKNTVPEICRFTAEVRFETEAQYADAVAKMTEIAATSYIGGTTCKLTVPKTHRVPMERREFNLRLLERVNEVLSEAGMPTLTAKKGLGGSDAADVTAAGIPCIDSLGPDGGEIHTIREYAEIATLAKSAKRFAAVAIAID